MNQKKSLNKEQHSEAIQHSLNLKKKVKGDIINIHNHFHAPINIIQGNKNKIIREKKKKSIIPINKNKWNILSIFKSIGVSGILLIVKFFFNLFP